MAMGRSRNRQVNPLDAPPQPKKSFYLTPISTPMRYQAIILAFRCPLTSICRGAPGQSSWCQSELVGTCGRIGGTTKAKGKAKVVSPPTHPAIKRIKVRQRWGPKKCKKRGGDRQSKRFKEDRKAQLAEQLARAEQLRAEGAQDVPCDALIRSYFDAGAEGDVMTAFDAAFR